MALPPYGNKKGSNKMTLTVERTINGFWVVSAIVGDYLETRRYMGYTKAESVAMFKQEFGI